MISHVEFYVFYGATDNSELWQRRAAILLKYVLHASIDTTVDCFVRASLDFTIFLLDPNDIFHVKVSITYRRSRC